MQAEKNYHPALTGIRAIAAWMVFVHHFNFFHADTFGKPVYLFFSEMHVGVTVFFVLSGLLITLRYYDKAIDTGQSFYEYMVKRFARLFPAFFLVVSANFIWLLATHVYQNDFSGGWKYYLSTLTLVRGFFADPASVAVLSPVPQSWSLTVEECFYILCPLIFLLIRKNIRSFIFIPLMLVSIGLALTAFFTHFPFHHLFGNYRFLFNFTFFGRCIEFFAGIGLALLYKNLQPLKTKGSKYTITGMAGICICVAGLAMLHTDEHYGDYFTAGIIINNIILPAGGIAVLFWGLLTESNIISKLLSTKAFVLLGQSSYIFYLVHVGAFAIIVYTHITANPILYFICLNVIALILYLCFEKPLNIWLRKKLLKKKPVKPEHENGYHTGGN